MGVDGATIDDPVIPAPEPVAQAEATDAVAPTPDPPPPTAHGTDVGTPLGADDQHGLDDPANLPEGSDQDHDNSQPSSQSASKPTSAPDAAATGPSLRDSYVQPHMPLPPAESGTASPDRRPLPDDDLVLKHPFRAESAAEVLSKYSASTSPRRSAGKSDDRSITNDSPKPPAVTSTATSSAQRRPHWGAAASDNADLARFDDGAGAPVGHAGAALPPAVAAAPRQGEDLFGATLRHLQEQAAAQQLKIQAQMQQQMAISQGSSAPGELPPVRANGRDSSRSPPGRGADQSVADDEDEDDEEADENALMDPDNPLMKRVQDALLKQLSERDARLAMEIKDKEEAVRKVTKKREEVGVELYQSQQQLARLQALLEGTEDNLSIIKAYKEEAERALKHTLAQHKDELEKKLSHAGNLDKHKQELDKISRTLKQVDLYNDELKSKILVAKRTTLKAEEDIVKQEQEKKRQDYFIDTLSDQLRRLQERRALYETQLVAQQRETKAATETLQEAATEMEAIQYEKRQLLHQWKSSLIGLQRRDEVLENIEKGISKNKDTLINLQGEINGFRQLLRRAQEQSETLTMLLTKLEGEVDHLKRQVATVGEQRERLGDTYSMYSRSLQQCEQDLASVTQERQAIQLEIAAVTKLTIQTTLACAKLETDVAEHLQNQLAIEKGSQGAKRDGTKLRGQIHEKEAVIATAKNEVGATRLEMLNTEARILRLGEELAAVDGELTEKNALVEKYELEIRRRNDELGKKQGEMDLLNKKYDQLMARNQDESMGPLEATIHNVTKLVNQKERDCIELQQFWLRSQNDLVAVTKRSNELAEETSDLKMRLAVLSRKKAVVNNQFDTESKEIREHQRNIRSLQNDMVKINTVLSKQHQVQSVLQENNLGLEQEFRARLKIAELDSIQMETKIGDLRSEKERALQGLVEAERQIMLWEKKIQLAKETQAALDPNVGATEIREMAIEIHRMKLRYASMLKLQEKMIAEMEKSVYRRESISMRTKTKGKGGGQALLQKEIAELTKKIRQTMSDVKEFDQDVLALNRTHNQIRQRLADSQNACISLEARENNLLKDLDLNMQRMTMLSNEAQIHQRQARRYSELRQGKYVFLVKDKDMREAVFEKQRERLKRIDDVIMTVATEYPIVREHMEPLHEYLDNNAAVV